MKTMFTLIATLTVATTTLAAKPDPRQYGWYADYSTGLAEAKKTGKPLMLVIRCDQCAECSNIDAELVRLHADLKPAAEKFVRVRVGRVTGLDLRKFDFDFDVTWFVFFLNADETIYGRYGGQDASDPESRVSTKGLRYAMDRALEQHKTPPKSVVLTGLPVKAEGFTAARTVRGGCIHCHNVNEFIRADLRGLGKWNREDAWVYPLPENIGITLDLDNGNKVKSLQPKSPAEKVGIKVGDTIERIGDTRVSSFADASYALHYGPKSGEIAIAWASDGKPQSGKLTLAAGWRKGDISWRPSMRDVLPTVSFSGEELTAEERKQLGLAEGRAAYKQDKFVHSSLRATGMVKDDVIVGFDGKEVAGKMKDLTAYVRRTYLAGDEVTINILRVGKPMELKWKLK